MNNTVWRSIGYITTALFVMLLLFTYIASTYSETIISGNLAVTWYQTYPYQSYAVIIGVCGIISGIMSVSCYLIPKYSLKHLQTNVSKP